MLAISQSGITYHYLNWVPSERGPLVTHYGSIQKEMENQEYIEQYYFNILNEILSVVNNGEPIFTFSLDRNHVLFSTCFAEDNNQELIDWHLKQTMDDQLEILMDYYHYPMESKSSTILNIGVPKNIRQSFQTNMRLLKSNNTIANSPSNFLTNSCPYSKYKSIRHSPSDLYSLLKSL